MRDTDLDTLNDLLDAYTRQYRPEDPSCSRLHRGDRLADVDGLTVDWRPSTTLFTTVEHGKAAADTGWLLTVRGAGDPVTRKDHGDPPAPDALRDLVEELVERARRQRGDRAGERLAAVEAAGMSVAALTAARDGAMDELAMAVRAADADRIPRTRIIARAGVARATVYRMLGERKES